MAASASAEDIEVPAYDEDLEEADLGPGSNIDEFYDDEYEEESIALIEGAPQSNPQLIGDIVSDYTQQHWGRNQISRYGLKIRWIISLHL